MAGTKKTDAEVVKVEPEITKTPTNLFGATDGENFMLNTLGQNFKQVKETQIQDKSEDIQRELERRIQDGVIELRRKARQPKDNLVKLIPTSALSTFNLDNLDPKDFCDSMLNWGIDCHNLAKKTLIYMALYKGLFGKDWEKAEEVEFVKSKIIDADSI